MTPLADWMSTPPKGLPISASLADAARLLMDAHVRQLVVTTPEGRLAGLATESAIFRFGRLDERGWVPNHPHDLALTLSAATHPCPYAPTTTSLNDALRSLVLSGAGALVVVDDDKRPLGVLSETDALDQAFHRVPRAVRVADLMQPAPYVVGPDDALHAAWVVMEFHGFRHLPVLDGEALVGVLSRRDLEEANADIDLRGLVREAMSPATETTRPWTSAPDAADIMRRQRIGCLPVTDRGTLVGLITATDMLRALLHGTPHAA